VWWPTRLVMWAALRMFGWTAWNDYSLQRRFLGEMSEKD